MTQDPPAPVCPRHPGRVAYVRCQRCDRPVCPECQVPSPVGVHCVDCARQAQGRRRGPRTILGGRPSADAMVTKALIAACAAVGLIQLIMPLVTSRFAFFPALALDEPWRFVTTAFLHASPVHLAFNMWALWVCGSVLEPVLGRWRFTALYGLSAVGGSTAIFLLSSPASSSWFTLTVGASGAVFGLFAALFVIQRRFGRDTSAIVGLLAINLVISVLGSGISWQGHLGGLLTGAAVSAVFAWAPRDRRGVYAVGGCVIVGALLVGGLIAAPVAAWLVSRIPGRVLGSTVGGFIALTNLRTILSALHAPGRLVTVAPLILLPVWALLVTVSVRSGRPGLSERSRRSGRGADQPPSPVKGSALRESTSVGEAAAVPVVRVR